MAARNLTIQLDEGLIRQAKALAAEQGLSLSAFVAHDLREKLVARARRERARQAALESMAEAAASRRQAPAWSREELYEAR
jgi:Family of unknown function (DUF6364)